MTGPDDIRDDVSDDLVDLPPDPYSDDGYIGPDRPRTRVVRRHEGTRAAERGEDFVLEIDDSRRAALGSIVIRGERNRPDGPLGVFPGARPRRNGATLALPCRRCRRRPVLNERTLVAVLDKLYQAVTPDADTGMRTVSVRLIETTVDML